MDYDKNNPTYNSMLIIQIIIFVIIVAFVLLTFATGDTEAMATGDLQAWLDGFSAVAFGQ